MNYDFEEVLMMLVDELDMVPEAEEYLDNFEDKHRNAEAKKILKLVTDTV